MIIKTTVYLLAACALFGKAKGFAESQKNEREGNMKNITMESTVGDIVAQKCSLSRVFETYHIDYCCGGKVSLKDACMEKGLDPQVVMNELVKQMSIKTDEKSWTEESLSDLIDHIQETHHKALWAELPKLRLIVEKVATVHGAKDPNLIKIRDIYIQLQSELEEHLHKEENVVFPYIKQMEAARTNVESLKDSLVELEHEHDSAGEFLHELSLLTHDFVPPEYACNTYRAMLSRLRELETDMHKHVHKENSILIPRALRLKDSLK
jgi:regulator of cell morphogenesis and NO signaling